MTSATLTESLMSRVHTPLSSAMIELEILVQLRPAYDALYPILTNREFI